MAQQRAGASLPTEVGSLRPRACYRCSRSKLKCTWAKKPGEGPCDRCSRSKSECIVTMPKTRGPKRGGQTRVAQLEQKLDNLLSLLTSGKGDAQQRAEAASITVPSPLAGPSDQPLVLLPAAAGQSNRTTPSLSSVSGSTSAYGDVRMLADCSPGSSVSCDPSSHCRPNDHQNQRQHHATQPQPPQQQSTAPAVEEPIDIMPGVRVTLREAERDLEDYRRVYAPQFPFVQIAPDTTAAALLQAQPLLFRVVVLVAHPQSAETQTAAQRWIRQQVAARVVVDELRDVADLQVILLYVAWFSMCFYIEPKTMPLLQLAAGLVADLGLTQPANHMLDTVSPLVSAAAQSISADGTAVPASTAFQLRILRLRQPPHSPDAMRAVLGCYYVCALSSALFRRPPVFAFTDYMRQCCDVLLAGAAKATTTTTTAADLAADLATPADSACDDALLVGLVSLQRIATHVYAALPNPEKEPQTQLSFAPLSTTLSTIRQDLDALWNEQPSQVKDSYLFRTHYYNLLVRLYEPVLYTRLRQPNKGDKGDEGDGRRRAEALWACLRATSDFFDEFLGVPPVVVGVLPLMSLALLAFGLVTVTQLALIDDPDVWDGRRVRRTLDLATLGARLEEHFIAAVDYDSLRGGGSDKDNAGDNEDDDAGDDYRPLVHGRKRRYVGCDSRSIMETLHKKARLIRMWYTHGATQNGQIVRGDRVPEPPPPPPPMVDRTGAPPVATPFFLGSSSGTGTVEERPLPQQQQLPAPPQQQQPATPSLLMDVDMDGFGAQGQGDMDVVFWQQILFNMDTEWNPLMGLVPER